MATARHEGTPANSETALCLLSLDGTVLMCNSTALALLRKETSEVAARRCHELFDCPHPMKSGCPLAKIVKTHRRTQARIRRNGCHVHETMEPLFDTRGAMSAVILSVSDSQRPTVTVPDLVRLQRLTAIAQATSGVVHDFSNIFARIAGSAFLLSTKLGTEAENPEHRELMDAINVAIAQGKTLTGHLLEFGRGHEVEKSDVVLTNVIRNAASFALIGHAAHPSIEIQEDLWPVKANAGQMTQLIGNLIINALHAIKEGQNLWILAENVSKDTAKKAGLDPRNHVRITVRDEGHGIPADQLEHVFEPFFTTKKHGTGLGLATASLIVNDHQGRIDVTSEVGRGTTFTIHLPAAAPSRKATTA